MLSENAPVELKLPLAGGRRPVENSPSAMAAEVGLNWLFDLQGEKKKEGVKIREENRSTFPLKEIINVNREPFRKLTSKVFSGNALKGAQGQKQPHLWELKVNCIFLTIPERWRFQAIKYRVPGGILWYTELNSAWKIEINSDAFHLHCAFL